MGNSKAREKFGVLPLLKDLILCHRRLILRSNWTLARLQESYQRVDLRRFERAAERRHIVDEQHMVDLEFHI